jgi:NAD(P)-dependent dehydrogenase (short-subunit alcohol dehydrogenase family)
LVHARIDRFGAQTDDHRPFNVKGEIRRMGMLDGRVAICTGSGRGVGAEVARLMATHGAKVVVNDPGVGGAGEGGDRAPADQVVAEITAAGGEAVANFGSVARYQDCIDMVQQARDAFGGLHIVFNAAGILRDRMFHNMSPEDWQAVIDVHLTGHFNINRAPINLFREQGYGRLILVSSTSGLLGNVGQANYGAAKMGIVALARIIALENAEKGITANVVAPSADTRMTRAVPPPKDPKAAALREERLRRSRADAIAPLCVFLASEQARYVNGQVFHQRAAELSVYSHPRPLRMVHRHGGWTPETIAEVAMPSLTGQFTSLADARAVHSGLPLD